MTLYYDLGTPSATGVYACRVPRTDCPPGLFEDIFLMWSEGKWWHLSSDQRYRSEVAGFLGPLARRDGQPPARHEFIGYQPGHVAGPIQPPPRKL